MGSKGSKKVSCPPGYVLVTVEAPIDTFDFEVFFFKTDEKNFLMVMGDSITLIL